MYKNNLKGYFFIDTMLSLLILSVLTLIIVPLLINLSKTYQQTITEIDQKQLILFTIKKYPLKEIRKGVKLEENLIKLNQHSICNTNEKTKHKFCISL